MKWLIMIIFCAALFITGVLYGIDKSSQVSGSYSSSTVAQPSKEQPSSVTCDPPIEEEVIPISAKIGASLGEGFAAGVDMIFLVLSEFVQGG